MKNSERTFYYYDLEVETKASGVVMPDAIQLINAIDTMWDKFNTPIEVSSGKQNLIIRDIDNSNKDYAILLIAISDTTAPNAVYSDISAGTFDEKKKLDGQGNEVGAHIIISKNKDENGLCLSLLEGVPGLSHSIVRRAINTYLNRYCKSFGSFSSRLLSGARSKGGDYKKKSFIPRFDFHGHVSDYFYKSIESGGLQEIILVEPGLQSSLSGHSYIQKKESEVKYILKGNLPNQNIWSNVSNAIQMHSKKQDVKSAKIRFKQLDGDLKKIEIDPITGTLLDKSYIKSRRLTEIKPFLSQSSEEIVPHLASKMIKLLEDGA